MSKKIIIMEKKQVNDGFELTYLYWLDVPVAKQGFFANPNATSAYKAATTIEIDALKSGAVYEVGRVASFNNGVSNTFVANSLADSYTTAQNALNNNATYQYFGTYWDGSIWTIQGA